MGIFSRPWHRSHMIDGNFDFLKGIKVYFLFMRI